MAAAQQCKFLIDKCWIKSARNEANKHSIHSSAGQGEPLGWSFPAWPQNSTNFRWPYAYAFWVEGAKLWAKKCRAEVLSCPAEEWDKGLIGWVSLRSQLPEVLPMETRNSISSFVLNSRNMSGSETKILNMPQRADHGGASKPEPSRS